MPAPDATIAPLTGESMPSKPRDTNRAIMVVLLAMAGGAFAAPFIRLGLDDGMPAIVIAAMRLFLAWIFFTPIILKRYRPTLKALARRDLLLAGVAGVCLNVHFSLMAVALEHTSVLIAQVLTNTAPIWVAGIETHVLKIRLPRIVFVGLILVLLGGTVIGLDSLGQNDLSDAAGNGSPAFGAMLALASAVGAAVYLTIGRKVRETSALVPYIWLVYGSGALTGVVFMTMSQTSAFGYTLPAYGWLLALTIIVQLLTHTGINFAVAYIPATVVSIAMQTVSVTSATLAFFLFAEVPQPLEMVGSAVIITGVIVAIRGRQNGSLNKIPART